ncbi:MAG: ABC transporter ATP-binding protein [Geminicoccales bacterium]
MNAPPVIEMISVTKSYGTVTALDGINLCVTPGCHVGLLGPNGAGKSTLFQILAGMFAQDEGDVRLFGGTHAAEGAAIRRRLGVVFQSRSVDLDMSVRANLRFHGRLFGLSGRALDARIDALSDQLGLDGLTLSPVRQLSGGQQRKVEIARALLNTPELLMMDEATAGLDATSRQVLVSEIRELSRDQGVAVIWATHLVDEVVDANEIVLLNRGRIVAHGSPEQVVAKAGAADLVEAYGRLTPDAGKGGDGA